MLELMFFWGLIDGVVFGFYIGHLLGRRKRGTA